MRLVAVTLVFLCLGTWIFSQEKQQTNPAQSTTLSTAITKEEVLKLPRLDRPPKITLQRALKVAESFIKKEKLDLSSCYLFEARWVSSESDDSKSYWVFWWVRLLGASGKDIKVAISMEGKPRLIEANEIRSDSGLLLMRSMSER